LQLGKYLKAIGIEVIDISSSQYSQAKLVNVIIEEKRKSLVTFTVRKMRPTLNIKSISGAFKYRLKGESAKKSIQYLVRLFFEESRKIRTSSTEKKHQRFNIPWQCPLKYTVANMIVHLNAHSRTYFVVKSLNSHCIEDICTEFCAV
jgi:hypothetical protein